VKIDRPAIPVVHNVDVAMHSDPDEIRRALAEQAASPVRWTETVRTLARNGVTHVLECGPGKVLSGLARRIDPSLTAVALFDGSALSDAKQSLPA
jgi:[acyl-carrier-protein] S-malonyltransferase